MKPNILTILFVLITSIVLGQKIDYSSLTIADSLKINANAVVRLNQLDIFITSQSSMTIESTIVTTVLNEYGLKNLDLVANYDKNTKITKIKATAYDAFGKELKTYYRSDFKDYSATGEGTVFSDNRLLYLDYTPINYPFTIRFETIIENSTTAFIPSWNPIDNYLVSTEKSTLFIKCKPELKLRVKEINFSEKYTIEKNETETYRNYTAKNILASKPEELSPKFDLLFPKIMFGLEHFSLEGIPGNAESWKNMGKWFYDEILTGTTELSEDTKIKIKTLVGNEKDKMEIAKIIYKYVQDKTRYVSIQEGIGGWKPMLAKDVDKLGYGDCKALTNYTRTLLNEVGVTSYYSRLYGDSEKKEIYTDIVSFQSNHVILAIPDKSDYIWLECTSQTQPFGFQGIFTDDRNAFIIKPDGGEIVKTKTFTENENTKIIKGNYTISSDGDLIGKLKMISKGIQYENEVHKERLSKEDQIKVYKEEFDNLNNLKINKISFIDDTKSIAFSEELELEANGYAQNTNGKLMFALNAFDQNSYVPKKYKSRQFPFEIDRGFTNEDEIEITIPDDYIVEAKPNGTELNTEYGNYKIEFTTLGTNKIICKRKLILKKGLFDKSKFEEYRKFRETIARNDNSKILITKKI